MDNTIWIWKFTRTEGAGTANAVDSVLPDVTGFDVESLDGHVGKVDEATYDNGPGANERGVLVVDTGFWIFGKKRMLPAGMISAVDPEKRQVLVACTKDQIKSAPDF